MDTNPTVGIKVFTILVDCRLIGIFYDFVPNINGFKDFVVDET